jgi:hypothetical protein
MLKNLRIGARLTLGFGLVLGLLCGHSTAAAVAATNGADWETF